MRPINYILILIALSLIALGGFCYALVNIWIPKFAASFF